MSEQMSSTPAEQQRATQTGSGEKVFTFWQATTIIPSTVIAVGVLTLPRVVATAAKADAVVSVILSGILMLLFVWMITKLGQMFPGLTFVGFTQKTFSTASNKRLGKLLAFPFLMITALWWLLATALVLRIFGEVQRSVVFPETPLWFMVGSLLIVCAFVAYNSAEVIARLNEFLFPLIIIPLLLIGILAFQKFHWTNLLPLANFNWGQILRGIIETAGSYQGISVLLIFMASYQQPQKAVQSHFIGGAIAVALYVLVTVASIGVFGHDEVQRLMWPTLDLVKSIHLPGLILERVESGFLGVWVVAVFTTVSNFLSALIQLIHEYFAIKPVHRVWSVALLVLIIFPLALWPEDLRAAFEAGQTIAYLGLILSLIIPPVLLLMAVVRRMGDERNRRKDKVR